MAASRGVRGQAAFEFLMTYGWVFLILVIVLSAMSGMGLFDPNAYVKKGCQRFTNLVYADHRFARDGTFELRLSNGVGEMVRIESVEVIYPNYFSAINSTELVVFPGDRVTLLATGAGAGLARHTGKAYSASVRVTYSVPSGLSGHAETATCTGSFE